jgi:hypothetical protein
MDPPILIVYYSIGFTKSTLKFWRQISKSGDGALLISRKILILVSLNQRCTIFSRIFCLMFLIDAINPKVEKKLKNPFYFILDCLGEVSRKPTNKSSFVSFRFRFVGGNKTSIQKKRESFLKYNIAKIQILNPMHVP